MGYESPLEEENFHHHADADPRKLPWASGVLFIPCFPHCLVWGVSGWVEDQVVLFDWT